MIMQKQSLVCYENPIMETLSLYQTKNLNTYELNKNHMNQIKINYNYEIILLLIKEKLHGRRIAQELNISLTKVQSILRKLREINILDYEEQGKNHIYFIKKNLISKSFILNAERYKLIKILIKYPKFEHVFQDIKSKCQSKMIILFGSYAKGIEKENSDVDIYIETINQKTKKDIKELYDKLSVKIGKFNPDNFLIKEIIKNHIIIQGAERFYEKIRFFE